MNEGNCQLCDARDNEAFRIVYRNDLVFAMINLEPVKDGHVMILPVRHVAQLSDLTADEAKAWLEVVDACMSAVMREYDEGPMFMVNGQKHRSQPQHLHGHVLPSGHDLRGLYVASEGVPERVRRSPAELTDMADRFREFFTV